MSPIRPTLTIRVVMARRYARTIHWTDWKEAVNACANVGKPALAMLVSREGINIDRERLASAQRTEAVRSAGFSMIGFKITSIFFHLASHAGSDRGRFEAFGNQIDAQ
jgi:uncharacterized iron-regulated protein